jgi:hypothetical protein
MTPREQIAKLFIPVRADLTEIERELVALNNEMVCAALKVLSEHDERDGRVEEA